MKKIINVILKKPLLSITLTIIFFTFLIVPIIILSNSNKNNYKMKNNGNNICINNLDDCKEYICKISSYEAIIDVTINSNKNTNKYKIKQVVENNNSYQEIIEPDNISGIKIIYKDNKLILENSKYNLSKVYNNYPLIESNSLFLTDFIKMYNKNIETKQDKKYEEDDYFIFEAKTDEKEDKIEKLYVNKKTNRIEKMIIEDKNKNIKAYILYIEVKL